MDKQVNGFGSTYNSVGGFGSNHGGINMNNNSNKNDNNNANSLQFYTMSKLKQDGETDKMSSLIGMREGVGGIGGNGGFSGRTGNNKIFNNANYSNYNYNVSEIGKGNISQVSNSNYVSNNINMMSSNVATSPNHYHPPPLSFNPSSSSISNNVPRKSPFNINETNDQFGGGRSETNVGGMMPIQGQPGNEFNKLGGETFGNVPLGPMSASFPQNGSSRMQTLGGLSTVDSGNPMDSQQEEKRSSSSSLTSLIKLLNPSLLWSTGQYGSSSSSNYRETQQGGSEDDYDDILNEPPLLEELGIDPANIARYLKCVIMFKSIKEYTGGNFGMKGDENMNHQIEWDMAGPILLIGCLGFFLLLAGKIHFGYIYGIGILSCIGTYILLNIMSSSQSIDLYTTMSILGYSLLPIVILAGISVIFSLRTKVGIILAIFFNMWSTITASRFFEYTVSLKHQRYLIAYPIALLYASFTIVTIF
ncbi:Yip1p like integral membrane protein [Cryptosporidium ubiquitum]|uniref:Yip1p like integral membrane protein n=1 Tax=Cryptosporidium ubiquitum TaxID=857276 RepID=A0A1J4MDI6_9CRYT|nr:Yip1p like integral membrane protein [Cryptosporidium ubiquitum]OII72289.1 Yip1p like integral membrane protein [Cryptosporidium ubiquitum]